MTANPVLKAAKDYRQQGYGVLPVDGKRAVTSWADLQERYPGDDELAAWWPDGHNLGIAVLTGAISGNLAVLDIDDAELADKFASDSMLIASTIAIRTPRGGLHLWVTETDGPSQSGPLLPGLADLKASGGYVLAPPSKGYRVLSKGKPLRVDNARTWALALLAEYGVDVAPSDNGSRPRLDVETALAVLEAGNRNETFTRIAGKLHRAGWEAGEIMALLSPHAERVDFPLAELDTLVRSVGRYPVPVPSVKGDAGKAQEATPIPYQADSLDSLLAQPDEALDAIIGDGGEGAVLTTDGKGFVAGPTGVGKTNLLLRLSRCLCQGAPFLGLPIVSPHRVLYMALEGSRRGFRRRLRKVWADAPPTARERFHLAHVSLNLANGDDLARLEGLLSDVRPSVLIIDPLRNAHPWDENLSHEMAHLTAILDALIDRYGLALILAHHDRKRPPFVRRDVGTDRVRGSTALTGWLQFCLSLDPDSKTPDLLLAEWTKTRDAEIALPPLVLEFDRERLDFLPSEQAPGGKVSDDAILDAIFHAGGSYRGPDLVAALKEGCRAGDRLIHDRLRALVKDGSLIQYVAPDDTKCGALTYALHDRAPVEVEL